MNQLIAIQTSSINNETKQTVNARELHEFLESKRQFADWIKERVEQFDFVENQDFVAYSQNNEKGRPSKEYALSLDMAKELSMVERNEKGKQARQYFIECEKKALQVHQPPSQLALAELMLGAIKDQSAQIQVLSVDVKELQDTRKLENWQQCELKTAMQAKIDGFYSDDNPPKMSKQKLYMMAWGTLNRHFRVPRYNEIPSIKFTEALKWVKTLSPFDLINN